MDLVTHWDLFETVSDKLKVGESSFKPLKEMTLVLVKMAMQNVDYCKNSPSVIVLASFLAAIRIMKDKRPESEDFCDMMRLRVLKLSREDNIKDHDTMLSLNYKDQF